MNKQQCEIAYAYILSCYHMSSREEVTRLSKSNKHLVEHESVLFDLLEKFIAVVMPDLARFHSFNGNTDNPFLESIIYEFLHDHFDEYSNVYWLLTKIKEPPTPLAFMRGYYIDLALSHAQD